MSGLEIAAAVASIVSLASCIIDKIRQPTHVEAHWGVVIQELVSLLEITRDWFQDPYVQRLEKENFRLQYEIWMLRMKVTSLRDYFTLLGSSVEKAVAKGRLSKWHNKEGVTNYLDSQSSAIREAVRNMLEAFDVARNATTAMDVSSARWKRPRTDGDAASQSVQQNMDEANYDWSSDKKPSDVSDSLWERPGKLTKEDDGEEKGFDFHRPDPFAITMFSSTSKRLINDDWLHASIDQDSYEDEPKEGGKP